MNTEQVGAVEHFGTDYAQACDLHAMPFVMNIIKVTPRTSTTYTAR